MREHEAIAAAAGRDRRFRELADSAPVMIRRLDTKCGALSVAQGRVDVHWNIERGDPAHLILSWCESGGLPVLQPMPEAVGQGSRMLLRIPAQELDGEAQLHFEGSRLRRALRARIESLDKTG